MFRGFLGMFTKRAVNNVNLILIEMKPQRMSSLKNENSVIIYLLTPNQMESRAIFFCS